MRTLSTTLAVLFALLAPSLAAAQDIAVNDAAPAAAATWWKPKAGTSFAIQLSVAPKTITTSAAVVDVDLFDIDPATVAASKRQGKKTVCYFSAGSWENWRPDAAKFPAKVKGKAYDGWAGERWLDIRRWDVLGPIMIARIDLCKRKGFDAVDPDNVEDVDTWGDVTGFHLKRSDSILYVQRLAAAAHARGLAFGLKNAHEMSRDPRVFTVSDFTVTEDCFAQGWCAQSRNFITAGKPVFALEYTDNGIAFAAFCRQAKASNLSPLLKKRNLDAWERRCP
jgi:hypothetical protein